MKYRVEIITTKYAGSARGRAFGRFRFLELPGMLCYINTHIVNDMRDTNHDGDAYCLRDIDGVHHVYPKSIITKVTLSEVPE